MSRRPPAHKGLRGARVRPPWLRSAAMVVLTLAVSLASYSVNLSVASDRAELRRMEREIVRLERDVRLLEAELGVRMRLPQLERWNTDVLALAPVAAERWLADPLELASFARPAEGAPPVTHALVTDQPTTPVVPRLVSAEAGPQAASPSPLPRMAERAPPEPSRPALEPALPAGYHRVASTSNPGPGRAIDPSLVHLVEQLAQEAIGTPAARAQTAGERTPLGPGDRAAARGGDRD